MCPLSSKSLNPFFTVGYSHRSIDEFLRVLRTRHMVTLIDVRHSPVSRHRPEFSKRNLLRALEGQGIAYVHMPALGVPKSIRDELAQTGDYDVFFAWYDANVIPHLADELGKYLANDEHLPATFMCMEEDPSQCHRSRISVALRRLGFICIDIG